MTTRTIDILLNLEAKPASGKDLAAQFTELEKKAANIKKLLENTRLMDKGGGNQGKRLEGELKKVHSQMRAIDSEAKKRTLEKSLKAAADQANRTRERMEKIAQVGNRLALAGGAILAPFALALKKYLDMAREDDPVAKRLRLAGQQLTELQMRLGKIVAEQVLPLIEKALPHIDRMITWLEENPDFVKAALTLGATLTAAGGLISVLGTIGQTLATLKTLGLTAQLAGGGGIAASIAPALASAISTAAPILAIAAAVVIAAEMTRRLINWALGTETTWRDIGITVKQLGFIIVEGFKLIPKAIYDIISGISRNIAEISQKVVMMIGNTIKNAVTSLGNAIRAALQYLANGITSGFYKLAGALGLKLQKKGGAAIQGRAEGGYLMRQGVFMGAEGNHKEFVLSNSTTRAAENVIGGGLTQARLIEALSGRGRVTYNDSRRFDASVSARDRKMIRDDTIRVLAGAL